MKKIFSQFNLSALVLLAIAVAHAQNPSANTATLNLNDADIRVLINTVSEATGKNFIIDPRVKAKVTVVSSKSMKKDELYEVFLSILDVHGFAAVPSGDIIKILPDVNAKQGAVPTGLSQATERDQLITQVVALENIAANQLVPILRPLVPQQGHLAAYAPTNVLVITDRAANISRLLTIIASIDRPDNDEIEIVRLEHASANEVVRIITALLQQHTSKGMTPKSSTITADDRTNSVLVTGDKAQRIRIIKIIKELDAPLESSGNTRVIFLKYSNAKDMVSILQGVSAKSKEGKGKGQANNQREGVDIQADEGNNALIITAQPSVIQDLMVIIRQLDIPRAQVMIEAVIAEVSTDLAAELGSQFLVGNNTGDGIAASGLFPSISGNNLLTAASSAATTEDGVAAAAASLLGEGLSTGFGNLSGDTRFAFIIRALQGDSASNILSTPTLVTMDNVEAEIVVGENVPFVTGSFSNTGGSGGGGSSNPFQTIQREDVGLTLKIKPQINEGDAIQLEIEQETSSVSDSSQASDLITKKRSIKTQILVKNGQTIVLGGLIRDEFRDRRSKVPLLGSIPILGRLFSYTKTIKIKSNLMVFIRPVILQSDIEANYYTRQKYSLIKSKQLDAGIGTRGLINDAVKELPNIEVLFTPLFKPAEPETLDLQ